MIEQIEFVQRVIEFLGLSESSAGIALEGLRMATGAVVGQALLMGYRLGKWLLAGSPLDPVEVAVVAAIQGGVWDEKKRTLTAGEVSVKERKPEAPLVLVDGNNVGAMLSVKAMRRVQAILASKIEEHSQIQCGLEREQVAEQKRRLVEKLAKKS